MKAGLSGNDQTLRNNAGECSSSVRAPEGRGIGERQQPLPYGLPLVIRGIPLRGETGVPRKAARCGGGNAEHAVDVYSASIRASYSKVCVYVCVVCVTRWGRYS